MMAELLATPWLLWLAVGCVLLAAEMLGASGYLLWSGVAALLVSLLIWIVPFSWEWQGVSFAMLTVLSAIGWYYWLKNRHNHRPSSSLNQRGKQLTGRKLTLEHSLVDGFGHVRIGDSSWRVQAKENYPAGTQVVVMAVEGITLQIDRFIDNASTECSESSIRR
ncbi:NfeD family protein [Erwinia psidii]|uniref:NfeD family protein n=1 Tax=Erwinia psidii TaxID=69224 RepID=A0A3N6TP89_9GAMM|nr:NfeD family protein [Erwinia psidii]RQM37042.1 NfeD family protein [Erwinia psidii]